nr:hypothetical protein [Tanacetum cinerariifolium]
DQSQPQQYTVDHPIFNAHNSYLDSQIYLNSTLAKIKDQMTSITSLCEMACQVAQKKLEENQIEEERAAKAKYWKLPVCYDDDDDEERSNSLDDNIISGLPPFSAITLDEPVLSTEEPDNSLSMGDEHLDTIPATESNEFIKSGVENLISIPSESEGIPEHMCDVPSHDNSPPLDVSKDKVEDFSESNKEFSSTDDYSFSFDKIDYVEASPPDSELVSSEVMEIVIPEVGRIDDDILLTIKHDVLREKLLNASLISKIEALNANPTPSSDCKTKSSSTSLTSLLEETNTFDNSLPEFETFCFDVEDSASPTTHSDSSLYASFMFDLSINPFPPTDKELEENLVTHSPDFQNTFEPSNASANVVNAPREPYIVKQDNGSFVDKIIFDFNRAPDSPNQFHCFHYKDVLRYGESCKRCTYAKCGSGLGKGLCYICGHNQNSLNDSPSISETSSQSPSNINHCCYECGDPLDGIFCKR